MPLNRAQKNWWFAVAAIGLFLTFDIVALSLNFLLSWKIEQQAVAINLSGRQRMLSQRMVKVLLQIQMAMVVNTNYQKYLEELQLTFDLFDNTLQGFDAGHQTRGGAGEVLFLQAVTSPGARLAVDQAVSVWKDYRVHIFNLIVADPEARVSLMRPAVEHAEATNLILLELMNKLTTALETQAQIEARRIRIYQTAAFLFALICFGYALVLLRHRDLQIARTQEHLLKAEEARELALDAAGVGVWSVDLVSNVWTWDARLVRMMGFPESVPPTLDLWINRLHPEDQDRVTGELKAAIEGKKVFDVEYRLVIQDGIVFHILSRGKVIRDARNRPLRMDGVAYDLTSLRTAEAAVREQQEHSQLLLESVAEGIYGIDAEGKVTFINPAASRLLGFSAKELLGRQIHGLIHHTHKGGGEYPLEQCQVHKTYTVGIRSDVDEEVFWRKDGSYFPARYTSTPVYKNGTLAGAVVTFSDITEQVAAKLAVVQRARWAEGLQEAGQQIAVCRSVPELTAVAVRVAGERLGLANCWIGIVESGAIRPVASYGIELDLSQHLPPNCQMKAMMSNEAIIHPDLINHPPYPSCAEFARKCGFGSCATFPISVAGRIVATFTMRPDKAGEKLVVDQIAPLLKTLANLVGHVWERCLAEKDMRKLSSAVEQSSAAVIITNKQGGIEYVNPRFSEVTGYTPEEIIGKNPRMLKAEGMHSPKFYADLWRTIQAGKRWNGELCNRKKNGELFWESTSISPIRDSDGEITHYLAVKEDITTRKKTQEELELFNRLAVSRELRMIEIKKEINGLLGELGRPPKYEIVNLEDTFITLKSMT